jgi:hypothetical protein
MRLLVHAIVRVQRFPLRTAHEHLAPKPFAQEDLLICELHTHPVLGCPMFVALGEGQSFAFFLLTELPLVARDTTKETDLDESAIDRTSGHVHAELATYATRSGELCFLRLSNDGGILLCSRLALATAARGVVCIFLRHPVAHGADVAGNACCNV